ncbi:protein kinase [Fusibacter paucivorans]|uniref:Protein kinase n=1 Tax=Fusibacter paucivorans TaxID=76009 RepID=A0ABS5PPH0_9FIRM|nr:protein kinase [Fusibacter paucivorans]MBS7526953.1 protein kinase [Fusibacter paucivorans]
MIEVNAMTGAKRVKKTLPLHRGLEEVKNLKALNGIRGIPSLMDYQVGDGIMHLFLQYAEGVSLDRCQQPFDDLFKEGLRILSAVHDRHILHRDICPRHLIVDETGSLTFIDFGSATCQEAQDSIVGTIAYAAPEALFEPAKYNETSDIFAYVKTFYRCYENRLKSFKPDQLNVLSKALALNQADRYETAEDLNSAFNRCL